MLYYIRNDLCFNIKNIFTNSIEYIFFSKFSSEKLNLLQLEYFRDLRMQIFKIYFKTISSKLKTKLMKFILSETLISTYLKMENSFSKKISHTKLKIPFLPNIFIDWDYQRAYSNNMLRFLTVCLLIPLKTFLKKGWCRNFRSPINTLY